MVSEKTKTKNWLIIWFLIVAIALFTLGRWVYRIDPYFHYHKPLTDVYFYELNNERSQNDGIVRHFDFDAMITGTSMTENFQTSQFDRLFGCNSVKVSFAGGSYKEINSIVEKALTYNTSVKTVVRCLDMDGFFQSPDAMRFELGVYPTYLYDDNPFNDVNYILNRDIIFDLTYGMVSANDNEDFSPGISSFDDYYRWEGRYPYGIDSVISDDFNIFDRTEYDDLTEEQKLVIDENIERNVTSVADRYSDVDFYYFYSPYSVVWWLEAKNDGSIYSKYEAWKYITEKLLQHPNIHLFAFGSRYDLTTDLNNYKDSRHYGSWINDLILKWMHDGEYELTKENYRELLKKEFEYYMEFDPDSLKGQEDYEDFTADLYAAALVNKELTGVEPLNVLNDESSDVVVEGADYIMEDSKRVGVDCHGHLDREPESDFLAYHIKDQELIGIKMTIDLDKGYNYLSFCGQKIKDCGRPTVYVFDENDNIVVQYERNHTDIDTSKHRVVLDLSKIEGTVTIVLCGGYINNKDGADSEYQFTDIYLY